MVGERVWGVVLALASVTAFGAQTEAAWKTVVEDGVTMKSREVEPGVFEVVAEADLSASVQDIEDVLRRAELFPRFMPYVKETRILSKKGDETLAYTRLGFAFLIEPRDYVTETRILESSRRGNTFRAEWTAVPDVVPEEKDVVRMKRVEGELTADGVDGRTHVHYRFVVGPGGEVPSFAEDFARREGVLKVLSAIEQEANERAFKRRTYSKLNARRRGR